MCCNLFTLKFKKLKNMKKENYLPFDLETALKHPERVVTRDGREVSQLTNLEAKDDDYCVIGVIDEKIKAWRINGAYLDNSDSEKDLFLLPEVKECWLNVFHEKGRFNLTYGYDSKEKAKYDARDVLTYIKTIRITNEPE